MCWWFGDETVMSPLQNSPLRPRTSCNAADLGRGQAPCWDVGYLVRDETHEGIPAHGRWGRNHSNLRQAEYKLMGRPCLRLFILGAGVQHVKIPIPCFVRLPPIDLTMSSKVATMRSKLFTSSFMAATEAGSF